MADLKFQRPKSEPNKKAMVTYLLNPCNATFGDTKQVVLIGAVMDPAFQLSLVLLPLPVRSSPVSA
jgi:hypothetical protein